MGFNDFVQKAVSKGKATNMQPRGRQTAQPGIDDVNRASVATMETAFDDVESFIEGKATSRVGRGTSVGDICDALIPANTVPSPGNPSLVVSLSPNSWDDGANVATAPAAQVIGVFGPGIAYFAVAQLNIGRQRILIQNNGTGNLFIVFGKASQFNADVTTRFHMRITPGQTYFDDSWQGRVDVASDTGTTISVAEFTRAKNVSQ